MKCILICAMAIVANVNAQPVVAPVKKEDEVRIGCTRICSHVERGNVATDPHCLQRCQSDVYNCIESTLPKEEAEGKRYNCIQDALLTRIQEDGDIVTKLAYDVEPTFKQFDECYQRDGRFDKRDMEALEQILHGKQQWFDGEHDVKEITALFSKIADKIKIVTDVYKEADQDGDGVVTEGEFNAYSKDSDTKDVLSHKKIELPDKPDLLAKKQAVFRSKKAQSIQEKNELERKGLTYFQHLLHLGLQVYRDEEKLPDPIEVLASVMFKALSSKINSSKTANSF